MKFTFEKSQHSIHFLNTIYDDKAGKLMGMCLLRSEIGCLMELSDWKKGGLRELSDCKKAGLRELSDCKKGALWS